MAKAVTSANKISFGSRKSGKVKKSYNKHSPRPKAYVGQGR